MPKANQGLSNHTACKLLLGYCFVNDALACVLGPGHWVDVESAQWSDTPELQLVVGLRDEDGERLSGSFNPKRVRAQLRRLHRDAERKASRHQLPYALVGRA